MLRLDHQGITSFLLSYFNDMYDLDSVDSSSLFLHFRLRRQLITNHAGRRLSFERHDLGPMNVKCPHCHALHWMAERLTTSSMIRPLFGKCCLQGQIRLPSLREPPAEIKLLFYVNDDQSMSFRAYTREYNASNAFTSLGVRMDDRVLPGRGPTSFTIHGELRHRTGSLLPNEGEELDATYAQLYIYDPGAALDIRHQRNPHLRRDVLNTIQQCLLLNNEFTHKYREAFSILDQMDKWGKTYLLIFIIVLQRTVERITCHRLKRLLLLYRGTVSTLVACVILLFSSKETMSCAN